MNDDLVRLAQAADFAARKHASQRRKGERAEPYVNHLMEVAALLAQATHGNDVVLVMGGLLHDTLEDTETSYGELVQHFGEALAVLVQEVTDDKSLPKAERKRLQVETTPHKSHRAKLLKMADKTSNLRALAVEPPTGWTEQRLREYVVWSEDVMRSCRGLNAALEAEYEAAYREAKRRFGA